MSDDEWKDYAKGLIKAEIARKNISLIDLAKKLESMGISETPQNISNKINRGTFGAIFMLQILKAIDCKDIRLILYKFGFQYEQRFEKYESLKSKIS